MIPLNLANSHKSRVLCIHLQKQQPSSKYSKQSPQYWVKKIITLLKNQTKGVDIVIVARAPSLLFDIRS